MTTHRGGGHLHCQGITVRFGTRIVLDRVDLDVACGEIVAILGPSGSGKSTLLRVIAGLQVPDEGRVLIDGVDMTRRPSYRRGVGFVFQDEQLFPHLDVADNIAFGLERRRHRRNDRLDRVEEMLTLVGLSGFEHRRVTDLSGGEAKRVALARALAPRPRLLLLDEPLTGLDVDLHDRLLSDLSHVLRANRITTLVVTHHLLEAQRLADRVVRLEELHAQVPPDDVRGPHDR